jgi:uncharacterized protein (DUF488 family)
MSTVYTIGHSTRSIEEFIGLLGQHSIERLADVRRYPGSRRLPHFSREQLAPALEQAAIAYVHVPELGGRRKPLPDSPNGAWRNEQFRGYDDHMATSEFRHALDALLRDRRRTAVMCAEAVPWRCHRNLLADELVRRGHEVAHIISPTSVQRHELHRAAVDRGDHLTYPPGQQTLTFGAL